MNFTNSQEASFRRAVRRAIKDAQDFTGKEKEIVTYIVNLWFHHRNGPKGYIHPSKKLIAKKVGCSVRTVATCLLKLRVVEVIRPVSHMNGGKAFATRYKVDIAGLLVFCGCDWVDEFIQNCTLTGQRIAHFRYAKIAHCISNVSPCPSQNDKTNGDGNE